MSDPKTDESHREIAAGAGGVALATQASRVLGLVRDTVIASLFTAFQTDCFFMALTIPNVLRRLLGEGSLSAAVVPVYTELRETQGEARIRQYLKSLWGASLVILCAVSVGGVLASPVVVSLYAWGYTAVPEKFELTSNLNRIMFSYIALTGLAAVSSGILNVHRKFFAPALSPALWNAAVIVAALTGTGLLAARGVNTVYALAAGVMIGGLMQLFYQFLLQRRTNTLSAPALDFRNHDLRRTLKLMVPLLAGFGIYQVDVLLSRLFASFLPQGSVSYLYYAIRLIEVPQGVVFLALGTASLPMMSRLVARGDMDHLRSTYLDTLSLTFFVSIPSTVGLMVMAQPIVCAVFFRGAFTGAMFEPTWMALALMSPGILGTAVVRVTSPVFYAFKDTKTPVAVAGVNLVIYIGACLGLMGPFKHLGLAAALSIAPITQGFLLMVLLSKKTGRLGLRRLLASIARFSLAAAGMALTMLALGSYGRWEKGGNDVRNILVMLAAGACGAAVYFLLCALLRVDELRLLRRR
jgi:putative peptidoglycan lipid II flippase